MVPENCPRGRFTIARTQVVKAKVRSQGDAAEGPDKSWLGRGQVRRQDVSFSYQKGETLSKSQWIQGSSAVTDVNAFNTS